MDMMELRFRMMSMIGGNAMIGKLSKYETKSLTFTNAGNDNNYVEIPVSFEPKLFVFSGGTDTAGNIISGAMSFVHDAQNPVSAGGAKCRYTNNNLVCVGYIPEIRASLPTGTAARCYYYDGSIYMTRTGTNAWWSNTDTYTFEIYG